MERILIVNVNWLGDTLFVTPFIRAVRESYPGAYIAALTHPRCKEILEDNPHINEIIVYDEKRQHRGLVAKFSIVAKIRSKKFDAAFILRKSLSRTALLFLSKIPERIGYDNKRAGFLLTKKVPPPKGLHKVEYFLYLARHVGIHPRSADCELFVPEEERVKAEKILNNEGVKSDEDFVVINPGGNWDLKRWPVNNFAKLADEIFNRLSLRVVLTGAEKDIDLCREISNLTKRKPVLLCGRTNLKVLGALYNRAKWVVSNDSGPMHIAAAVKAPIVALFGPTAPSITGPYGKGVYKILKKDIGCDVPCYNLSCGDNRCMKAITVEDVLEAMTLDRSVPCD